MHFRDFLTTVIIFLGGFLSPSFGSSRGERITHTQTITYMGQTVTLESAVQNLTEQGERIPEEFRAQWSQTLAQNEQARRSAQDAQRGQLRSATARLQFKLATDRLDCVVKRRNRFYANFTSNQARDFTGLAQHCQKAVQNPEASDLLTLKTLPAIRGQWGKDLNAHVVGNSFAYAAALAPFRGCRGRGVESGSAPLGSGASWLPWDRQELDAAPVALLRTLALGDARLLQLLNVEQLGAVNGFRLLCSAIVLQESVL